LNIRDRTELGSIEPVFFGFTGGSTLAPSGELVVVDRHDPNSLFDFGYVIWGRRITIDLVDVPDQQSAAVPSLSHLGLTVIAAMIGIAGALLARRFR